MQVGPLHQQPDIGANILMRGYADWPNRVRMAKYNEMTRAFSALAPALLNGRTRTEKWLPKLYNGIVAS